MVKKITQEDYKLPELAFISIIFSYLFIFIFVQPFLKFFVLIAFFICLYASKKAYNMARIEDRNVVVPIILCILFNLFGLAIYWFYLLTTWLFTTDKK